MLTTFDIYLIMQLDNIKLFLLSLLILLLILFVVIVMFYEPNNWFKKETNIKLLRVWVLITVIVFLLNVFVPTSKAAAAIYKIPNINDVAEKAVDDLVDN